MRAVVQRVSRAEVRVGGRIVGRIGRGLLVLVGVRAGDTEDDARYLAEKVADLRVFPDDAGRMNRSVVDVGGSLLAVSQFTLYGDCRKGRRPSYDRAEAPDAARILCDSFVAAARERIGRVEEGEFRAMMEVELVNDGPVTLLLDSERAF
ncbi:MAG: D-tyrosyl-tRNA(Tyr) deacylase [Planctomycetes bacterium]|nr:D-tyrosyl-tRNA(Tyr) deacylase [Planctomycetota bacterium]